MPTKRKKVIAVVGPTASGKTDLARRLAVAYNGELISADSRQVYRGLDIGTGKEGQALPNQTALTDRYPQLSYLDTIPQWLVDIREPEETYTVAEFQHDTYQIVENICQRDKVPIIVGGTGLYLSAVLEGYDFSSRAPRDQENPRHSDKSQWRKTPPDWDVLLIGPAIPREELYRRIDDRVDRRLKQGMIAEVESLIQQGVSSERLRQFGLEYRYIVDFINGELTEPEFAARLKRAIHHFARRQLTWWRHHGPVEWLANQQAIEARVAAFLSHDDDV